MPTQSVVATVVLLSRLFAGLLARLLARFLAAAATELGAAGRRHPCLVLEQAGGDLGAIRDELAADALSVADTGVLPAAAHVVGALRRGGRSKQRHRKAGGGDHGLAV